MFRGNGSKGKKVIVKVKAKVTIYERPEEPYKNKQ